MPEVDQEKLDKYLEKGPRTDAKGKGCKNDNPFDSMIELISRIGCRPTESLDLFTEGRLQMDKRIGKKECLWTYSVPAHETKTKRPYKWIMSADDHEWCSHVSRIAP